MMFFIMKFGCDVHEVTETACVLANESPLCRDEFLFGFTISLLLAVLTQLLFHLCFQLCLVGPRL